MVNNTDSRVVGKELVQLRMADGRSVTLTEVRHVPNLRKKLISIRILDSKGCSFDASGGTLRVFKGNKAMLWGGKIGGLYRLEGSVQTGRATVQHGSSGISKKNGQEKQPLHRGTQSKRRDTSGASSARCPMRSTCYTGFHLLPQPSHLNVHREAQRKETKSILRSYTANGVATPKQVSFALDLISGGDLSNCAHKGGEIGVTTTRKVTYFAAHPGGGCKAPQWGGCRAPRSYGGAGSKAVRMDNLKTSNYPLVTKLFVSDHGNNRRGKLAMEQIPKKVRDNGTKGFNGGGDE
ncbi:hypothetical protein Acr_07g0012760 [Actinidia rufa]|uniref:Retrovirus-related Pol polyprotein from transposon TNT 1-94-like beta-barrel domain-containing protein n=1 Tax=Actinidia rufa TaxID=165716 RepID=A0A7J0EXE7_9ERIC|nr:hypothetical protein Acr_07g0012760 [Actinidia rufa]